MPTVPPEPLRALARRSWEASCRRASTLGSMLILSPASFAGFLLEISGDDIVAARALIPNGSQYVGFWLEVRQRLDTIEAEDRIAKETPHVAQ